MLVKLLINLLSQCNIQNLGENGPRAVRIEIYSFTSMQLLSEKQIDELHVPVKYWKCNEEI